MPEIVPFNDFDEDQFRRLIAQESSTPDGQKKVMDLIEELFLERRSKRRDAIRIRLTAMGGLTEQEVDQSISYQMSQVSVERFHLGDEHGRHNLILGKGSGDEAKCTIMIPAHVDSFGAISKELLQLKNDEFDADRKRGRKTWDMGAAILNSIAGAAEFDVPEGMQVYWVFTVDEERNSLGARKLFPKPEEGWEGWEGWKRVDLVLSSEIGELTRRPAPDDRAMRYITARRGRLKMIGSIDVMNKGHGANPETPCATEAENEAKYLLRHSFYKDVGFGKPPKKTHPLLIEEKFETRDVRSDEPEGDTQNRSVTFKISQRLVPPSTLESALEEQKRIFEAIAAKGEWARWNIQHSLKRDPRKTSYEPYEMPEENTAVEIAKNIMRDVSGAEPVPAGAWSASDECLYFAELLKRTSGGTFVGTNKGVVNIPIIGNHAHSPEEWVSWRDAARVRTVIRMLIEHEEGYRQYVV